MKTASLMEHLSVIKDFRQAWKVEHKLTDILFLTICAVVSSIPSADTIARVIGMISPKQFQRVFADWMQECHTASSGEVIAIDGKTLRASYDKKLLWCLDVGMNEDACRIRRDKALENLAGIRHIAMNYLKNETSFKGGIKRKQKKAAMMESYLTLKTIKSI